jgi:hypothetical protein
MFVNITARSLVAPLGFRSGEAVWPGRGRPTRRCGLRHGGGFERRAIRRFCIGGRGQVQRVNAVIRGKPDNLDEIGQRFDRARLATPVYLNSVPKAGTHLIRNIMRMFVAPDQHWRREYIQHAIMRQSAPEAFSKTKPMISWGHMLFSDEAAIALRDVRHIVLVRDPYDWVLARARFYLSDEFQGNLNHIKGGAASPEDVIMMMILGAHGKVPDLKDIFALNAVAWMGSQRGRRPLRGHRRQR